MPKLTDEQKRVYLDENSALCPFCRSGNIVGGHLEASSKKYAFQDVQCEACGESWTDEYTLTGVEGVDVSCEEPR